MTAPVAEAPEASPFHWRLAHRPDVRFGHAAGGVAGVLVAAAVVALVVAATDDDATFTGAGFALVLIAVALAAGWRVRGPVRSAAVAAIALAVPQVWLFAAAGDGEGFGRSEIRLVLILSVATYVALYLLTWTRGRAVLLGLALLLGASWIVFEVAKQEVPFTSSVVEQVPTTGFGETGDAFGGGDKTTEAAVAQIVIAVVLLGAGVMLDRRRRAGAATPCLLVGGLFAVNGAITLGTDVDDVYAAGAFVVVAGLAIGLAGSLGRRRGTSWIGAIVLLAGALTLIAQGTEDTATSGDGTAVRFAIYALLGAAALLTAGVVVARRLAEPVDGGEPGPPAPAPPAAPDPDPDPEPGAESAVAAAVAPAPSVAWSAPAPEPPTVDPPRDPS